MLSLGRLQLVLMRNQESGLIFPKQCCAVIGGVFGTYKFVASLLLGFSRSSWFNEIRALGGVPHRVDHSNPASGIRSESIILSYIHLPQDIERGLLSALLPLLDKNMSAAGSEVIKPIFPLLLREVLGFLSAFHISMAFLHYLIF